MILIVPFIEIGALLNLQTEFYGYLVMNINVLGRILRMTVSIFTLTGISSVKARSRIL